MAAVRIFLSHSIVDGTQKEAQVLAQLLQDLRSAGAEVIFDRGNTTEESSQSYLQQMLSTCQWLLVFQTPDALSSARVQLTVRTASTLIDQGIMKGAARFIAAANPIEKLSPEWEKMNAFDGSYDYSRSLEKLLITFALHRPTVAVTQAPPPAPRVAPPPSVTYDRPSSSPSRLKVFKESTNGTKQDKRRIWLYTCIGLLILTLLGSSPFIFMWLQKQGQTVPTPVYGHVFFSSSDKVGDNDKTGICDGIQVDLQNLNAPAAGNSYYAWFLPDKKNFEGPTPLLGQLQLTNGTAHLTYASPTNENLLAVQSRFLVTEESASTKPDAPTADRGKWRYYAEISQTPNPNDAQKFSNLDHLRHLLASDPKLNTFSLNGGLNVHLYQNMLKIQEWATWSAASIGSGKPYDGATMHDNYVRIIDYLDGPAYRDTDLTQNPKPKILADLPAANVPLLTFDEAHQDPPGYVRHISTHLRALTESPGATAEQRKIAGQISAALDKVKDNLEKLHTDVKQLVNMPAGKLTDAENLPLVNDVINNAREAYGGRADPATGNLQGGVNWIYHQMPLLAQFTVVAAPHN